jgi:hypothetical protein
MLLLTLERGEFEEDEGKGGRAVFSTTSGFDSGPFSSVGFVFYQEGPPSFIT